MYRCSIHEMLTEKLQNCNGFFTMHRYPPFLNSNKDKEFSFNLRQQCEAFINTDMGRFKAQMSSMGPPSWQGLILIYLYLIIHFAGFLIMLSPNRPFASNSFIWPKTIAKVAILKTKSAIIAFFSSPSFLFLTLSFSPFLFLCYCDFGSSQA